MQVESRNGARTEAVYDRLREAIIKLELEPGAQLSQMELCRQLGVSRTPLREALRMLERERFVQAGAPHSLVTISPLSMADFEDLYVQRVLGEALAAWLTVPLLDRAACQELARLLRIAHTAEGDTAAVAHRRFHAGLRVAAGQRIQDELEELFRQAERYQFAYVRAVRAAEEATEPTTSQRREGRRAVLAKQAEHDAILRACRAGDRPAVVRLVVDHTVSTAHGLIQAQEPGRPTAKLDAAVRMSRRGLT